MADNLHILNGDSTWHLFQEAGISGHVLIWREILCEGPVSYKVASPQFWEDREQFVTAEFAPGSSNYKQLIEDFKKLKDFHNYKEITLWFEYDLFCQINMVALLSWCFQNNVSDQTNISLVCVGHVSGYDHLIELGRLPPHRYAEVYEERIPLTEPSLAYADMVWKAYCSEDPRELDFARMPHPVFSYLGKAIESHQKRFPATVNNLSEIEFEILNTIQNNQVRNVDDLVRHMLQWQKYYGFGDMQYFSHIRMIKDLINFDDPLTLSKVGRDALNSKWIRSINYTLGGSDTNSFQWNDGLASLVPV